MKSLQPTRQIALLILLLVGFTTVLNAQSTTNRGRVVINEYMPWPSAGCGATAEFIELLNFGPGPMDIGCYILTDGDYSITIPPNTILQPGQFYVIAGQNTIPVPCANIDSTITVDLNWNTCGCTSAPIPTTGDGLFTDGGSASEQLVLMDPNANVVDAVVRDLKEPSALITTSGVGGCPQQDFDLDLMNVQYEVLGMSAGRGNSFARLLDGDCGWVKDPQQSGSATNNTPGDKSEISYLMDIVDASQCGSVYGSIEIHVKHADYSVIFPMNYTIVFDVDNDGDFDFNDSYTYGVDVSPPSITVSGLFTGKYRITVASVNGCFLESFDFQILSCFSVLPVKLEYFRLIRTGVQETFEWKVTDVEDIQSMTMQKSNDGFVFETAADVTNHSEVSYQIYRHTAQTPVAKFYRLKIRTLTGRAIYSPIVRTGTASHIVIPKLWPSPAKDMAYVSLDATDFENVPYKVFNSTGSLVASGNWHLGRGKNVVELPVQKLPTGVYQLLILRDNQPTTVRFVRQ